MSDLVGAYDIDIIQGAVLDIPLVWSDESKVKVPLTGYSAKMQIRPSAKSKTIYSELSTANGRITLVSPGEINLYISAEDTANFKWLEAVYDLTLTPPDGKTIRLLEGLVTVKEAVTR